LLLYKGSKTILNLFKMRHLLRFILSMLLVISSCTKDPQSPPPELIGNWEWKITYGVQPKYNLTPQNTGIEKLLVITEDFGYKKFENDLLVDSGTFSVGHGIYSNIFRTLDYDSIVYRSNMKKIEYGDWDYYKIDSDTLSFCLCYRGATGTVTYFIR